MSQSNTTPPIEPYREIATTADGVDITRGYTGPLMVASDTLLQQRGGGDLRIYEQVYSDPEVKGAFNQRQLAVTKCEWDVEPGGDSPIDIEAADHLREQLQALNWDNITAKMLFGVFYGYAVAEVIYRPDVQANRMVIHKIKVRNRRRFRFSKEGELRMLTQTQQVEGVPAEAPYFWHFCTGADHDDEPYGIGLAHWLYWPVLFKRNGIKFWLIFLEKFGQPTAVGKYDPTATDTERARLLAATRAIAVDAGVIMPKGMELDLLEAARSGTADYKALCDRMDGTIAKVVLGQVGSSQGTPGKLGNDDLMGDVRQDIIKADADLVCESFNVGPAREITQRNFPGAKTPKVYRVTEPAEDLDKRADRDTKVKQLGYKPKLAYITRTYGDDWEPVSQPAGDDLVQPPAPPAFAERDDRDPASQMADQLQAGAEPQVREWVEKIRQAANRAQSFAELRTALDAMAVELDIGDYAAVMGEAFAAAELAGRYEAQAAPTRES